MDWGKWLQNVGGDVIKSYASSKYEQPYEIQKMRIQVQGADGGMYDEGAAMPRPGTVAGLPSSVLLIGGAVVLALVLMRN